jgi:hypothetical protein
LSEAIHEAKKTTQALYTLQLEDFQARTLAIPLGTGFRQLASRLERF